MYDWGHCVISPIGRNLNQFIGKTLFIQMKLASIEKIKNPRITIRQILEGIEGIVIMIACYLTFFLKAQRGRWGLRKEELTRTFPGDEIIDQPKSQFTHAINIDAPVEAVWPWIAQIGQGRGGFYTYEALENMTGMEIRNADIILAEFQDPKVGDLIPFSPTDAYPLVMCETGRAMAIGFCIDLNTKKIINSNQKLSDNYSQISWLWIVEPIDSQHSRFYSRNRVDYSSSFKNKLLFGPLIEPIVFTMDRKMCLGIKKRAEKLFSEQLNP